jgi:hypothetical protein
MPDGKLVWDDIGKKFYETGVDRGVVYPQDSAGIYPAGYAWNGLISVTDSPSGAEANPNYADNSKYLNLISAEDFGYGIEAYTYPEEFEACDGSAEIANGVSAGQQKRKAFGFCYRSQIGNDVDNEDYGYKLHLIYGSLAAPSEKVHTTINESPEAVTFSWDVTTTPVPVPGFKPSACLIINSKRCDPAKLTALEEILYGKDAVTEPASPAVAARLPLPAEVITLMGPVA